MSRQKDIIGIGSGKRMEESFIFATRAAVLLGMACEASRLGRRGEALRHYDMAQTLLGCVGRNDELHDSRIAADELRTKKVTRRSTR